MNFRKRPNDLVAFLTLSLLSLGTSVLLSNAVVSETPDPVLLAAGDITNCSRTQDESTAQILDNQSGTVVTLGDNAYPDGTLDQFNTCYEPTWGRHKDRTNPSPGNHDYHVVGAAGYFTYFGDKATPQEPGCTANCLGYYSYNLGDWHIVALNSEIDHTTISPQVQWLRADLAANPNVCTLAYYHKPRFSSGQHGSNTGMQAVWQALYDNGVDVVLNGHDHLYERFAPQDALGQSDPDNGVRAFIVGTGGASLYSFPTILPNSEVRENTTWRVLKLTLHPAGYAWEFLPIAGQTFTDSGTSTCSGATVTPTATPDVSLTPTATPDVSPTPTEVPSPTPTPTETPVVTSTPTVTPTPTLEPSPTPTPTLEPSPTPTATPFNTPTPTPSPAPQIFSN